MVKKELSMDRFPNTDVQAVEVTLWSGRYNQLLASLGRVGSEIRVTRTLETDQDIAPGHFVRDAVHHFIFPKQETTLYDDQSHTIDATPGYELQKESRQYTFNSGKVTSLLEVSYDDSESRIDFRITNLGEDSNLQPNVRKAIEEALSDPKITS
jgi:hypothetical protein